MITQHIELGDAGWYITIYYNVNKHNADYVLNQLIEYGCPKKDAIKSLKILLRKKNCAFTFSNTDYKLSIVGIGECDSQEQFVNSVVHECKHVQSHICEYYNITEQGETAAYLIGHIVQRMYKVLRIIKYNLYG